MMVYHSNRNLTLQLQWSSGPDAPDASLVTPSMTERRKEGRREAGRKKTKKKDLLVRHDSPQPDQTDRPRQIVSAAPTEAGGS